MKRSCDFIGRSSLKSVTILPDLVATSTVLVEILPNLVAIGTVVVEI